jgi:hypothetical protein
MPGTLGEKVHLLMDRNHADAPGAEAPLLLRPSCNGIVLPGSGAPVLPENRMRPPPLWGEGWRKGGICPGKKFVVELQLFPDYFRTALSRRTERKLFFILLVKNEPTEVAFMRSV